MGRSSRRSTDIDLVLPKGRNLASLFVSMDSGPLESLFSIRVFYQ
jgi:hypothetical protein